MANDVLLNRQMPAAVDAERALLAVLVLENRLIEEAAASLAAGDFYLEAHDRIFRAIVDLWHERRSVDLVTLSDVLARRGQLEAIGGRSGVAALIDGTARVENLEPYVAVVRDAARRRELIRAAHAIMADAFSGEARTSDVIDAAERAVLRIGERRASGGLEPVANAAHEWVEHCEAVKRGEVAPGVRVGVRPFDKMTGGLRRQTLTLLAARPKLGKTSFALNAARHAASEGAPVAFFSLEMGRRELVARLLCDLARVDSHRVRAGAASVEEMRLLASEAIGTTDLPLYVDDTAGTTVPDVRAKVRRLKRELGPTGERLVVVIDYLQLLRSRERRENRTQEVSAISRDLKLLAMDEDVPVLALSQLSRAPEQRTSHRPQLSDLRESGALEQDADMVVFLHAEPGDMHKAVRPTELIVEAHRAGPTGSVPLVFLREYTRFEEAAPYGY
jgi:replicative DNA helicase